MLFHVPHTRKQKRYLEALEAGMDTDAKVAHCQQSVCEAPPGYLALDIP